MKLAIIKTGGKQYIVNEGKQLSVEKLSKEKDGRVIFEDVLLYADSRTTRVGAPMVKGATVKATVLEEGKGKKVRVIKFKAKTRYRRHHGHRQHFTKVKIDAISAR